MSPLDDICVVGCLFAISFVFLLCYSFCLALVYELGVFLRLFGPLCSGFFVSWGMPLVFVHSFLFL